MPRLRMPAICGRNSSGSLRQSEVLQSREGLIMKRCLLITALVALPLFVTSSVVAQEDTPVFGKVTTNKKTALKAAPNAHAAAAATVDANTDLRWVMGDRKGKYVRVMVPRARADGFWKRTSIRLPMRTWPALHSKARLSHASVPRP